MSNIITTAKSANMGKLLNFSSCTGQFRVFEILQMLETSFCFHQSLADLLDATSKDIIGQRR